MKRDDLTDTAASGNKLRKLEYAVARALAENTDLLITCGGVQSNHCRSTAIVASQLGLRCHLILRGEEPLIPDGNLLLDRLAGAGISFVAPPKYHDIEQCVADVISQYPGSKPYFIPVGASDETGLWGYIQCCAELRSDFSEHGINPGFIVSATGSGGTLGGLTLGNHLHDLNCEVLAFNVCDDEAYFLKKIREDFNRWEARYNTPIETQNITINVIDGYVGDGYGIAGEAVFDTIKHVASTQGIILDPVYTGKAFNALIEEISHGRFENTSDVVFIHTGGIFGNFPQRDHFGFQPNHVL